MIIAEGNASNTIDIARDISTVKEEVAAVSWVPSHLFPKLTIYLNQGDRQEVSIGNLLV